MGALPLLFLLASTTATGAFSPGTSTTPLSIGIRQNPPLPLLGSRPLPSRHSTNSISQHALSFPSQLPQCNTALYSQVSPTTPAAAAKERQFNCKKRIATFMAFMTGWADFLLVKKYQFFGTMMTGNTMWFASALVENRLRDVMFYSSVIAAYCLGVGAFRRAELSYKNKALNGLFAPIVAGFLVLGDYMTWRDPAARWVPALLLSFAWAIINSVGSEVTGNLIFVVTGAYTRISNMIVDRISRTAGRKKIQKEGLLMPISVIGGFFLGVLWSTFLNSKVPQLKTGGAFSIMGVLYGSLFLWIDREELGAWWSRKNGAPCEVDEYEGTCN